MTNEFLRRLRTAYGIVLSASIAVAGICLMAACVGIYRTGDHPFSREAVAAAFSPIAVPVYLCLVLVIGGFILDLVLPEDVSKRKAARNQGLILERLQAKTDLDACDETLRSGVLAQRKRRTLCSRITAGLLVLGCAVFLIYVASGDRFHQSQISDSIIRAMLVLLPCMAVPFGFGVFTAYHNRASMEKEIALLKQAGGKKAAEAPAAVRKFDTAALRNAVAAIALALLIFGFCTGGTADVLTKAVNICTECVGLG